MPDLPTYLLGVGSGLIVGLIVGWFGHRFSLQRSRDERRIADETARIERCAEMFAARVSYVVKFHKNDPTYCQSKARREELERAHPHDTPESILSSTPEWERYVTTERAMLAASKSRPQTLNWEVTIRQIDAAAAGVHRLLEVRRRRARA
jgi:hypothetical protein